MKIEINKSDLWTLRVICKDVIRHYRPHSAELNDYRVRVCERVLRQLSKALDTMEARSQPTVKKPKPKKSQKMAIRLYSFEKLVEAMSGANRHVYSVVEGAD